MLGYAGFTPQELGRAVRTLAAQLQLLKVNWKS
jgi:hypothetical protein